MPFDGEGLAAILAPEELDAGTEQQTVGIDIQGAVVGREIEQAGLVHGAAHGGIVGRRDDLIEQTRISRVYRNPLIHEDADGAAVVAA